MYCHRRHGCTGQDTYSGCPCVTVQHMDTYLTGQQGLPVRSVSSQAGRAMHSTHRPRAAMSQATYEQIDEHSATTAVQPACVLLRARLPTQMSSAHKAGIKRQQSTACMACRPNAAANMHHTHTQYTLIHTVVPRIALLHATGTA